MLDERNTYILMIMIPLLIFVVLYCMYFYLKKREKELLREIHRDDYDKSAALTTEIQESINSLRNELNEKKLEAVINVLSSKRYEIYSENSIVNSLINHKLDLCQSKGIEVSCQSIILPDKLKISEAVALLGNLFDNAIEACEKCIIEGKKAEIEIDTVCSAGVWILVLKNSKLDDIKPVKMKFRTTKADYINHGLGMRIINEIVNKYRGIIKINDLGTNIKIVVSI